MTDSSVIFMKQHCAPTLRGNTQMKSKLIMISDGMVSSYLAKPSFFHITRTNGFGPFPFIADNYAWVLSYLL
jgi:hypothetical protein